MNIIFTTLLVILFKSVYKFQLLSRFWLILTKHGNWYFRYLICASKDQKTLQNYSIWLLNIYRMFNRVHNILCGHILELTLRVLLTDDTFSLPKYCSFSKRNHEAWYLVNHTLTHTLIICAPFTSILHDIVDYRNWWVHHKVCIINVFTVYLNNDWKFEINWFHLVRRRRILPLVMYISLYN